MSFFSQLYPLPVNYMMQERLHHRPHNQEDETIEDITKYNHSRFHHNEETSRHGPLCDLYDHDIKEKIITQMDPTYHVQWPNVPLIHQAEFDLTIPLQKEIITPKEADFLLSKSIRNKYFYFNVTQMIRKLPLDVTMHILKLLLQNNSLKEAILSLKARRMCNRFRLYRNLKGFETIWDSFLASKDNQPQKYIVITITPTQNGVCQDEQHRHDDTTPEVHHFPLNFTDDTLTKNLVANFFRKNLAIVLCSTVQQDMFFSMVNWTTVSTTGVFEWRTYNGKLCCERPWYVINPPPSSDSDDNIHYEFDEEDEEEEDEDEEDEETDENEEEEGEEEEDENENEENY